MPQQLLTKGGRPATRRPPLSVIGEMRLADTRAHEICGHSRRTLAALVAAKLAETTNGPMIWITPAWWPERVNGDGLFGLVDPGRFIFVHPTRPEDLLWGMEEALRSGTVPLVICDVTDPPSLTPVRRLHLAAQTGAAQGAYRPLGLLLTTVGGGAAGVESRWALNPAHLTEAQPRWRLERLRDRTAPPASWHLTRHRGEVTLERATSPVIA
ncbi:hypothetical protein [Celeribacter arenosi]|uniref:Protein ImuA n=1 Tax=Celeribacter arenosi TaxID=792649 RepID=A0ABP7KBC8_9RHOB